MRALCIGDLHLGAGPDLGREPGERLAEQSDVLAEAVSIANQLHVDALFWLGDAWERRRPTPAELDAFQDPISRLDAPLYIVPGNHDVEGAGRITGYDVALFGRPKTAIGHEPAVYDVAGVDVAILPWAPRSTFVAQQGGGDVDDVNREISAQLLTVARGLRAQCGERAILVAHWSVGGASTDSGMPTDLFREPVLDVQELAAIGFDAIVLGHIHRPQGIPVANGMRPIFYVGSPMPLNFGEATPLNFGEATGDERGALLLDVGEKVSVSRIPIQSRKLVIFEADADDLSWRIENGHELRDGAGWLTDLAGAIVKAKVSATDEQARRFDVAGFRRELEAAGAHKVWAIQVEVERAETVRGPRMDETVDDLDAMKTWLDAQPGTFTEAAQAIEAHTAYMEEANR